MLFFILRTEVVEDVVVAVMVGSLQSKGAVSVAVGTVALVGAESSFGKIEN